MYLVCRLVLAVLCLLSSPLSWGAKDSNLPVSVKAGNILPFWLKSKNKNQALKPFKVEALLVQPHQVTNQEYIDFLRQNVDWRRSQVSPLFAESNYLTDFKDDMNLKEGYLLDAPVTYVSWFAAKAYCESLNLRLPTILEWEYLAAADEKKDFAYENPKFLARILEWYGQTQEALKPVKSVYRSKYGIHDMHGLVWEWVGDFNSNFVSGESRADSSFDRDLFCGGGSLGSGDKENYAAFMRFAFRSSLKGNSNIWNLGFRCVKEGK